MFELFSDAATINETMLMTFNTSSFYAEATSVASVLPCRHSFDAKLQPGHVLALARRHAR